MRHRGRGRPAAAYGREAQGGPDRLLSCSRPECPATVLRDCSQWMNEVVALMPTVVLGARDAQGRDVLSARVSMDGVVVANGLDGKTIEVDPGTHTFRFEAGGAATEQRVLIREGEKGRLVSVTLDTTGATPVTPATPATPSPTPPARGETPEVRTSPSPWTWILRRRGPRRARHRGVPRGVGRCGRERLAEHLRTHLLPLGGRPAGPQAAGARAHRIRRGRPGARARDVHVLRFPHAERRRRGRSGWPLLKREPFASTARSSRTTP